MVLVVKCSGIELEMANYRLANPYNYIEAYSCIQEISQPSVCLLVDAESYFSDIVTGRQQFVFTNWLSSVSLLTISEKYNYYDCARGSIF